MKKIEQWARILIITAGILILGIAALRPAKTQEPVKIQVIEVTPGFSAAIAPGQQVVGFSCVADERLIVPSCYALVK